MYTFRPYQNEDRDEVLPLLETLWGCSPAEAEAKFEWKYLAPPTAVQRIPAFVALVDTGAVAGFRGFLPMQFSRGDQTLSILSPADAIVSVKHRRQGIFNRLLSLSMEELAESYDYFLNFSSNRLSTAGYLKRGWEAVGAREFRRRLGLFALFKRAPASIKPRLDDGVRVTRDVEEYIDARMAIADPTTCFSLSGSSDYWRWRLSNPGGKYHFLMADQGGVKTLATVSLRGRALYLIDWKTSASDDLGLQRVLKLCSRAFRVNHCAYWQWALPAEEQTALRRNGYYAWDKLRRWLKRDSFAPQVLLRPVCAEIQPADWLRDGQDLRAGENWRCLPISSDAT